jgi:Family of unknown function (DUF5759)
MANIFTLENFDEFSEKINLDELYEKKRKLDLNKLELFKKILNRIHVRIRTISRQSVHEKHCWFVIPEMIIGIPKYDQAGCIAYIMNSLQENKFMVRYFHPNTLFISWNHWVPTYVRNEIKKKTGIMVNEIGETLEKVEEKEEEDKNDVYSKSTISNNGKKYTPIQSYKPLGKLVYSEDLLNTIEDKIN